MLIIKVIMNDNDEREFSKCYSTDLEKVLKGNQNTYYFKLCFELWANVYYKEIADIAYRVVDVSSSVPKYHVLGLLFFFIFFLFFGYFFYISEP